MTQRAHMLDNRDPGTTWVWIDEYESEAGYVEINPIEFMANMIENCYNEDVTFLFETFCKYLEGLDEFPDIKDDNKSDHIVMFMEYLVAMIQSSKHDVKQEVIDACANGKHDPFEYMAHPSGDVVARCRHCRIPMPAPKTGE